MNIFLDTSSLVKLYHAEQDSHILDDFFSKNIITTIYLSEIAKAEFASAFWKKSRTNELDKESVSSIIRLFESDYTKYIFISVNSLLIDQAKILLETYSNLGLRTLDSLQLASYINVKNLTDKYFTADKILHEMFKLESVVS